MSVDSSAQLPPNLEAVTTNPETQTFAVAVDRHHLRAHLTNQMRRDQMHQAGQHPLQRPHEKPVL